MADGGDGPAWVDLTPLWGVDGDCDLIIEANEPDAFRLRDVYEHFRRKEMTGWEWERELAADMNGWKVHELEREIAVLREAGLRDEVGQPANGEQGVIDCVATVDESGLPREVSTAEAARILGVSKDTVLKLKVKGLLEYRIASPPGSCRPIFRFLLQSVLHLRTRYEADEPTPGFPRQSPRRHAIPRIKKYKHVKLED